jgi:hypothetical protein
METALGTRLGKGVLLHLKFVDLVLYHLNYAQNQRGRQPPTMTRSVMSATMPVSVR